jgi:hypothetical protein
MRGTCASLLQGTTALTPSGTRVYDKKLPNAEARLRELFTTLQAKHGTVLVIVDQPPPTAPRRRRWPATLNARWPTHPA